MIELQAVSKTYSTGRTQVQALRSLDLTVDEGEFAAVQGSSGSGKSTLLNILGILDRFDTGSYTLDGTAMDNLTAKQAANYRNRFIGFVFQSFNLIQHKTAAENVALPLYYRGINKQARMQAAHDYLERVGVGDRADHLPKELSGGQSQRVAIARAMVTEPALLLADEPTGALDTQNTAQIMQLLHALNRDGTTLIVVTHEDEVARQADRVIQLQDGEVVSDVRNDVQHD
jgi:putative ABC transport system ATP-binding protein